MATIFVGAEDTITILRKNRTHLMGWAILFIMLCHQSWIWGWNPFFAFFHFFGNWGVDVFFFVSGFGLFYSLSKDKRSVPFYQRRIVRLLPLCFMCGIFRYIIDHILPVGVGGYPTGVHEVTSNWMTIFSLDKWFILSISLYYFLMPLFYNYVSRYGYKVLYVAYLIAIICGFSYAPGWIWKYTSRLPSFLFGVVVAANTGSLIRGYWLISILSIFAAAIYKTLIMFGWVEWTDYYTYILLSGGITLLCLFLAKLNSWLERTDFGGIILLGIAFLGRHSLEIYLIHEFVYRYTYRFLIESFLPPIFQLLVGMAVAIFLAFMFSQLAGRFVDMVTFLMVSNSKSNKKSS